MCSYISPTQFTGHSARSNVRQESNTRGIASHSQAARGGDELESQTPCLRKEQHVQETTATLVVLFQLWQRPLATQREIRNRSQLSVNGIILQQMSRLCPDSISTKSPQLFQSYFSLSAYIKNTSLCRGEGTNRITLKYRYVSMVLSLHGSIYSFNKSKQSLNSCL